MGNINTRSTEKRKKRKYHEDRKEESKGLKNEQMRNTVWKKHLIKYCEKLGRNRNKQTTLKAREEEGKEGMRKGKRKEEENKDIEKSERGKERGESAPAPQS